MIYLKKFNEDINYGVVGPLAPASRSKVYPRKEDVSILELIKNIFSYLIDDYDPYITEYTTGVTKIRFEKLDFINTRNIDEYTQAVKLQLHLVENIKECIDKLRISVPGLVSRIDTGTTNIESKYFYIYLGSKECGEVINVML